MTDLIKAADALAEAVKRTSFRTDGNGVTTIIGTDGMMPIWEALVPYIQARENARSADVHRRLKEMLFELIGSVQNSVADPVREDVHYGGVMVEGGKLAYLRLSFEEPKSKTRESADGVKVKPLVWECEGGWRWKGTPPDGFFTSVAKWVWQAPKGGFKHAGTKEPFATLEEAKAAAQADYEARIKAALED